MKLLSFAHADRESWGVLEGAVVLDLGARPALETPTLAHALGEDGLMGIAMNAVGLAPDLPVDDLRLLPPVPRPSKIICVDGGSWSAGTDAPGTIWTRFADSLAAPGRSFAIHENAPLRWRPGIAAVVGSHSHRVPLAHAHEMIAGYTCFADCATGGLSGAAAFGPWLLTPDEFLGTAGQELTTRINGRIALRHPVSPLAVRLCELLAHCSAWTALQPGDVLAVLAPLPADAPDRGWKPVAGDTCEVELPLVGVLGNDVIPCPVTEGPWPVS